MAPSSRSRSKRRHQPLEDDLVSTGPLRSRSKKRKARPENEETGYVGSRASRKILKIGQDLAAEEQANNKSLAPNPAFAFASRLNVESDSEQDAEDDEAWGDEEDVVEEVVRVGTFPIRGTSL